MPFATKEKVEQTLLAQVAEGELIPVGSTYCKHDGGMPIGGGF